MRAASTRWFIPALVLGAIVATATRTDAQQPVRFSVVGGLSIPSGDLGRDAAIGLNLAMRGEGKPMAPNWSLRGDVSYDQYGGYGPVDRFSYLAFAGNLVHRGRGSRFYQFGGLGVYRSSTAFANASDRADTNLGMQVGGGVDLTRDKRVFAEFGLTSAFTSRRSSLWLPMRIGMRF
jgi:hypothetical protein